MVQVDVRSFEIESEENKPFAFIQIKDARKSIWVFSIEKKEIDAFDRCDDKEKVDKEREDKQMMLDTKIDHK